MAHISHPILGDTAHGDGKHNQFVRSQYGLRGLALHACRLGLVRPIANQPLRLETRIDDRLLTLLFGWGFNQDDGYRIWSE